MASRTCQATRTFPKATTLQENLPTQRGGQNKDKEGGVEPQGVRRRTEKQEEEGKEKTGKESHGLIFIYQILTQRLLFVRYCPKHFTNPYSLNLHY